MDRNVNRSTVARRLGVVCLSVLLCGVEAQAATPAQGWRIDEAQTSIGFTIDAVGFPTTHGRFAHYRGRLLIDFDRPAKSYTTFTVDAASLDVGSATFSDFVKNAVLLNVERFPTMSNRLDAGREGRCTYGSRHRQFDPAGCDQADHAHGRCCDRSRRQRPDGRLCGERQNSALGLRHDVRHSTHRRRTRNHGQDPRAVR